MDIDTQHQPPSLSLCGWVDGQLILYSGERDIISNLELDDYLLNKTISLNTFFFGHTSFIVGQTSITIPFYRD